MTLSTDTYTIPISIALIVMIFIWVVFFYPNNKNIDNFTMATSSTIDSVTLTDKN